MDLSSAHHHHHQEMASQTLESMLVCTKPQQEKKPRPPEEALKCPRCDSTSTKFCYYNNYSLSQPRYFCKSCRRYWTKGGTLRNVPVGGGCRKNKRSSSSSSSSSKRSQEQPLANNSNPLGSLTPFTTYDHYSSDLSLAFARIQKQHTGQLGFEHHELAMFGNNNGVNTTSMTTPGTFDGLRNGFLETPNGFHSLYHYGNMGHVDYNQNGGGLGMNVSEEMAIMPYHEELNGATTTSSSTTVTTMKQEICNMRDGENRVLWGFPWQVGGDANMVDLDSAGRQSWNGFGASYHGLINSPLM